MVDGKHASDFISEARVTELIAASGGSAGGVAVGTYGYFAGDNPPDGWLECNGAAISRTAYPELFAVIGTKYGVGDRSSTFNLPNAGGIYLVGRGTSRHDYNGKPSYSYGPTSTGAFVKATSAPHVHAIFKATSQASITIAADAISTVRTNHATYMAANEVTEASYLTYTDERGTAGNPDSLSAVLMIKY